MTPSEQILLGLIILAGADLLAVGIAVYLVVLMRRDVRSLREVFEPPPLDVNRVWGEDLDDDDLPF